MGSRYLFIVLYVFLERHLSRGDYQRPALVHGRHVPRTSHSRRAGLLLQMSVPSEQRRLREPVSRPPHARCRGSSRAHRLCGLPGRVCLVGGATGAPTFPSDASDIALLVLAVAVYGLATAGRGGAGTRSSRTPECAIARPTPTDYGGGLHGQHRSSRSGAARCFAFVLMADRSGCSQARHPRFDRRREAPRRHHAHRPARVPVSLASSGRGRREARSPSSGSRSAWDWPSACRALQAPAPAWHVHALRRSRQSDRPRITITRSTDAGRCWRSSRSASGVSSQSCSGSWLASVEADVTLVESLFVIVFIKRRDRHSCRAGIPRDVRHVARLRARDARRDRKHRTRNRGSLSLRALRAGHRRGLRTPDDPLRRPQSAPNAPSTATCMTRTPDIAEQVP